MDNTCVKHIAKNVILRIVIYLAISIIGANVMSDQLNSIRNDVYGIGDYMNIDFVSNMLVVLNLIFIFVFVLFCFFTRKALYTPSNMQNEKLNKYVMFEIILEFSVTIGYVILSTLLLTFIKDNVIRSGIIVPIFIMCRVTESIIISAIISILIYVLLIFAILLLPYIINKNKDS